MSKSSESLSTAIAEISRIADSSQRALAEMRALLEAGTAVDDTLPAEDVRTVVCLARLCRTIASKERSSTFDKAGRDALPRVTNVLLMLSECRVAGDICEQDFVSLGAAVLDAVCAAKKSPGKHEERPIRH